MSATTQVVEFDGAFLQRGFWLYVWHVRVPDGRELLYVGRTGDSSSPNAQSPFNRMGQHLGFQRNSSMLRTHLGHREVDPQLSRYRIVSHGPVLPEAASGEMSEHKVLRDQIAAIEHKLEADLRTAGYDVMNTVRSKAVLDESLYATVRAAFAGEFPGLHSVA
jgi:hypothetical protein